MAAKKNSGQPEKPEKKKSSASSSGAKAAPRKKSPKVKTEYERSIPANVIIACVSLILFVLFIVITVNPEGKLLLFIRSVLLGLFGQAGFYFSIPALLYLFFLQVFGKKENVTLRSVCLMVFVFCCGSIFHLIVQKQGIASGFAVIPDLYQGGAEGLTGGVLCGGAAMLLRWACGNVISYILIGILTVLSLFGALQVSILGLLRAIATHPKRNWAEEDQEAFIQPAAPSVKSHGNKTEEKAPIHQMQRKPPQEPEKPVPPVSRNQSAEKMPAAGFPPLVSGTPSKASAVMSTIDLDIGAPISAAKVKTSESPAMAPSAESRNFVPENKPAEKPIPVGPEIPAFVRHSDLSAAEKPKSPEKPAEKPVRTEKAAEKKEKITSKDTHESARQVAEEIEKSRQEGEPAYCFPPISLLKRPSGASADGTEEMRENSRRLNETLASFHIDAHITNVTRGPSVTRYEVELDKGVRLSKLTNCADDIALSLGASGVRIAAVPGKISIVGIEVPNRAVTTVSLREVIDSPEFARAKSKSSFSVGKDISGACIIGNISKMPHMLIAGTTGSGKSVCMNSIIISLLYKAGPEDVKLIMVDPKMVELGIYNGIPHLLIPVVTDPKKAAGSLQWAVTEMLRRYKLMSDAGVRDLESYNSIMVGEEDGQKLPQIVIIIDELADLMLVAAKEVEDSICRVAQMGRAAGMHLIIATQRPSADVITGLMKANIPSRIAFSVASAMESRIILDTQGAEKLVGKGDMLYAPIGCGKPLRVQGCFVTDAEVEAVAGYVKDNYVADYNQQVLDEIEKKALQAGKSAKNTADPEPSSEELEGDEMLPAAVDVILETGQASVSMLQRRLKLGYARAARIVDEMEEKGIVGPFLGSKPRAILITKEKWEAMRGGNIQMEIEDPEQSDDL